MPVVTLRRDTLKSNAGRSLPAGNRYARSRVQRGPGESLQEDRDAPPAERLLQAVWQQQRLLRDQLHTLDGQPVRILHPGFKNHEPGPDFHGAIVQIGDEPARSGDIEVDLRSSGWHTHGHDRNPAFHNVILHVIWEGEKPASTEIPVVALRGKLDAPIGALDAWLGPEALQSLPEELLGQCSAPLRDLPPERLRDLLHQAAQVRWQAKAAQFQARARHAGWEQALWEGLFRALGYKHNTWPMQNLAESRSRWLRAPATPLALQARLLGVSGLLPAQLTRTQITTDNYVRTIWDQWWREREEFSDCAVPRQTWRFSSLRPANHPQRRIALASHWLATGDLVPRLEKWFAAEFSDNRLAASLEEVLRVGQDDFWSWHWTLRSDRMSRPQPLLGGARVTDLAVNVILPWFCARAAEGGNESLQHEAERRFSEWPPAEDNSVLRLARRRLLGGATARALPGAAAQQGLLQIVRDFCDHSNSLCENCRFPELVRGWSV
jgi:hypothetical protein